MIDEQTQTAPPVDARDRRRLWTGLAVLAISLALLAVLKALPYSSVTLGRVEPAELERRPTPDFSVGPMTWRVSAFALAPELAPFRQEVRAACGEAKGSLAAGCLTRRLTERVPAGAPSSEYVNLSFDLYWQSPAVPVQILLAHSACDST
jgi:hypothetical protein